MPGKGFQPRFIYGVPNPNASEPERASEEMDGAVQSGFRSDFVGDTGEFDDLAHEGGREYAQDAMEDALAMRGMDFGDIDEHDPAVQDFYDECAAALTVSYGHSSAGDMASMETIAASASSQAERFLAGYLEEDHTGAPAPGHVPDSNELSIFAASDARHGDITPLQAQEIILSQGGGQGAVDLSATFSEDDGIDIDALQRIVTDSGDGHAIYQFATYHPDADLDTLQDAILASGDGVSMAQFAARIEGADVTRLQQAVIDTGDAGAILEMLYCDDADASTLQDALIATGDGLLMSYAATDRGIDGLDFERLQDGVIASGSVDGAMEMMEDTRSDTARLQEVFVAHGTPEDMRSIMEYPGVDTARLRSAAKIKEVLQ